MAKKEKKENKGKRYYNWVFHFNYHTELWSAIPRERYTEYWSTPKNKFLQSGDINTLMYKVDLLEKERCLEKKVTR